LIAVVAGGFFFGSPSGSADEQVLGWRLPAAVAAETRRLATEYMSAYINGDFHHMYSLLSPQDQAALTPTVFRERQMKWRAGGSYRGDPEVLEPSQWDDDVVSVVTRVRYTPAVGRYKGLEGTSTILVCLTQKEGAWYVRPRGTDVSSAAPVGPVLAMMRMWAAQVGTGAPAKSADVVGNGLELMPATARSPTEGSAGSLDAWLAKQADALASYGLPTNSVAVDCIEKTGNKATVRACVALVPIHWDPGNEPPPTYREAVYSFQVTARGPAAGEPDKPGEWRITRAQYVGLQLLQDDSFRSANERALRDFYREATASLTRFLEQWKAGDADRSAPLVDERFRPTLRRWIEAGTTPVAWGAPRVLSWLGMGSLDMGLRVKCDLTLMTGTGQASTIPHAIDLTWARGEWRVQRITR
jgi:hypothetical protein